MSKVIWSGQEWVLTNQLGAAGNCFCSRFLLKLILDKLKEWLPYSLLNVFTNLLPISIKNGSENGSWLLLTSLNFTVAPVRGLKKQFFRQTIICHSKLVGREIEKYQSNNLFKPGLSVCVIIWMVANQQKTKSLNLKVDEQVELVPLPDILFCYINFFCPSVLMIWLSALQ